MQTWAFPVVIEQHGADDFVATFPDIPGAVTGGGTLDAVRINAADALEEAILHLMSQGEAIPAPRAAGAGEELVLLDPVTAARAILAEAMRRGGISNVALAKRLGRTEGAIRRLTDGTSGVKIDTVIEALTAVGKRTVLSEVA